MESTEVPACWDLASINPLIFLVSYLYLLAQPSMAAWLSHDYTYVCILHSGAFFTAVLFALNILLRGNLPSHLNQAKLPLRSLEKATQTFTYCYVLPLSWHHCVILYILFIPSLSVL